MLSNRGKLKYLNNYYLVNTETQTVIHDTGIMPAEVSQSIDIDFIYAQDHSLYESNAVNNLENMNDIREGKWIIDLPRNEINMAWKKIKESIRLGKLWMCKATPKNESATHCICVYIPEFTHIPTLLTTYNYLVSLGLVNPKKPLPFKADQASIRNDEKNYYTSDQLPELVLKYINNHAYDIKLTNSILEYLGNQISELDPQTTSPEFISALRQLNKELIDNVKDNNKSQQQISTKIAAETACMLINLQKSSHDIHTYQQPTKLHTDSEEAIHYWDEKKIKSEEKIKIIQTFENNCNQVSGIEKFFRSIATVIMTGVGMILGATIGVGIGATIGAIAGGPFAVITGSVGALIGLMKGAITGYAVSLATGSLIAGITTGSVYGRLFFKPTKQERLIKKVAEEAHQHYKF